MDWTYEKLDEDYKVRSVGSYTNDTDGKITGHIVMNVKAWFDENPAEARRLGWTKHITHTSEEIKEICPHNPQTQYLVTCARQIDEYTIEDTYYALDKSPEMLRLEELMQGIEFGGGGLMFFG